MRKSSHWTNGRALAAIALVTAMLPLLTSCGIPTGSGAQAVEPAPTGVGSGNDRTDEEYQPTDDIAETVRYFLRASAGDSGSRDERLHVFTGDLNLPYSELSEGLRLVEIDDVDVTQDDDLLSGEAVVTGDVLGTYLLDGQVRMMSTPGDYEETFALSRSSLTEPWTITDAPSQVALTYFEFRRNYRAAPLYFLGPGNERLLVPDLRWIYSNLPEQRDHLTRLEWLLAGPSDWSRQSTRTAIPSGATLQNLDTDLPGDNVAVELEASASGDWDVETAEFMAAQIAWTLNMTHNAELELSIDGTVRVNSQKATWDHWNSIPADGDAGRTSYAVRDDEVWQLDLSRERSHRLSNVEPWANMDIGGITQVSVGADGRVAVIGDNGRNLYTGSDTDSFSAVDLDLSGFEDVAWLSSRTLLVLADGAVVHIELGRDEASMQELPLATSEELTGLVVAPDGHRIAFVAGDRAFVATLARDADGNHQIGEPRRIGLNLTGVQNVVWSREYSLMVIGESASSVEWLFEVSIDNAQMETQSGTSSFPRANDIASAPADPRDRLQSRGEPTVVVIGGNLYRVHSQNLEQINTDQGEPLQGTAPFVTMR
ncbi:LpqB family beta-propeller domain-containing protein [Natronoglycomyces albus]|uniref:GerMN domain-containing protein n=1 Tax=Natronoglycomyces albus TaxID=2811108 RepID=A0A895XR07_9ACTN|nr:LpqB family beta-propeller domain-containing protein [Natronoglycomyces albus]QSB05953.1 hypothetical protein JQS30_03230 [Natronoglycomyces albus]